MKSIYRALCLSVLGVMLFSYPVLANTKIAVVDLQRIVSQSLVGKTIHTQAQNHKESFLKQLSEKETALRAQEKKLLKERETLSQEEFAKKAQEFEKQLGETRLLAQTNKKKLDKAYEEAMKTMREKLHEVITSIAKEKEYDLVISRMSVVMAADSLDITDEALKRLDKELPEVTFDLPSAQ